MMRYLATVGEFEFTVEIENGRQVTINGMTHQIDLEALGDELVYSLLLDGRSYEALVSPADDAWQVLLKGVQHLVYVEDERERRLRAAAGSSLPEHQEFLLKAPMPGLIVEVPVTNGQEVKKGDVLLILESMKMQNELKSPRNGVVSRIRVEVGDSVNQRDTLLIVG